MECFANLCWSWMGNVILAEDIAYTGREGDEKWHNVVNVTLSPVPGLSKEQREALLAGLGATDDDKVVF